MAGPPKTTTEADLAKVRDLPTDYMARWRGLYECMECGRKMRPKGTSPADYPATVQTGPDSMCHPCYLTSRRKAKSRNGRLGDRVTSGKTLAEHAKTWTEDQHAVAWQVASRVDNADECAEVLAMLGLFSDPEIETDGSMQVPHLTWHGRPI